MLPADCQKLRNNFKRALIAQSLSNQRGFTLVELLVVISLTVVIMLSVTSMFLIFLVGNAKNSSVQVVKSEGEYTLNQMSFMLRNAVRLEDNGTGTACAAQMNTLKLKSIDANSTIFSITPDPSDPNNNRIASNSAQFLTSPTVTVIPNADGQPLFSCQQSADGSRKYVTITFTLRKGTVGVDETRDIVEQRFQSGVALRNF